MARQMVAVRLAGCSAAAPQLIGDEIEEGRPFIDLLEVRPGPEGWAAELRLSVDRDDAADALVAVSLALRLVMGQLRTPVLRIAMATA